MKKQLLLIAAVSGVALSVSAAPITGTINFSGNVLPVDALGNAVALNSATGLDFQNAGVYGTAGGTALVTSGTTDFAPFLFTTVNLTDFQFNPLSPSPVVPLWITVGGVYQFNLHAITVGASSDPTTFLNLSGVGVIQSTLPTKDDTYGTWSLTVTKATDGNEVHFSFTSGTGSTGRRVPDGGLTAGLLGLGMLAVGGVRRFIKR